MVIEEILIVILIILLIIIISALPLYLAVTLLGGRTSILKTFLVMVVSGIVTSVIAIIIPFGAIIAWIFLIWIYKEMFHLGWLSAILAWILQFVFIILLIILFSLLGIGIGSYFAWA